MGIVCALFVVLWVASVSTTAGWAAALCGLWFAWLWYGLPLLRRRDRRGR